MRDMIPENADDQLTGGIMNDDGQAEAAAQAEAEAYAALCNKLKGLRDKAIKGRAESGIEQIWLEDEEFYAGIDDVNRGEKMLKATSPNGQIRIVSDEKTSPTRSTVFVEITRPYVDAAAARVADMLLPTDDRNWAMENTPIPELVKQSLDTTPVMGADGQPMMQQAPAAQSPSFLQRLGLRPMPQQAEPKQMTVGDLAKQKISEAKRAAEKGQTRIDDWLTESGFLDECRTVIDDAARIGTGILKGPTPKKIRRRAVVRALESIGIVVEEAIQPCSGTVNVWNFYPDPDCGEDIQRGKYTFESDDITGRMLGELRGLPGYIDAAIDEVLETGPIDARAGTEKRTDKRDRSDSELYEIWYFHGYMSMEDLDMLGTAHPGNKEQFPVIATMVNDKIIKAALSPLDTGEFPYDVMVWQRRAGHWAGKGVARQMRTEQRGVNAAVRNMMDNAGLSSGPMFVVDRSKIEPLDGNWTLAPRKGFATKNGQEVGNVRDALWFFVPPSMQAELQAIIEFWLKRAEDVTGLPMLLQGQLGNAPDTVGGMSMLNNNATSVLRRIARYYDARITIRHIGRYYEWLLMYGEDDSEKGDFAIKARGSSALVERDAQNQFLMNTVALARDPVYKLDPQKIMSKLLKSQRISAEDVEMEEEQWQRAMQGMGQSPQVAVAQIREQGMNDRTKAQQMLDKYNADQDRALEQWQTQVQAMLDAQEQDGARAVSADELKAKIFEVTRKLTTQIQLSRESMRQANDHKVADHMVAINRQAMQPPTEPTGRAAPGNAFIQ